MTKKEEDIWERKVLEMNRLHTELQRKPEHLKKGFSLTPGSILNAFREGDLNFADATELLRVVEDEGAERPIILINKCLRNIWNCLAVVAGDEVYLKLYAELGDNIKKLEAAENVDV